MQSWADSQMARPRSRGSSSSSKTVTYIAWWMWSKWAWFVANVWKPPLPVMLELPKCNVSRATAKTFSFQGYYYKLNNATRKVSNHEVVV